MVGARIIIAVVIFVSAYGININVDRIIYFAYEIFILAYRII